MQPLDLLSTYDPDTDLPLNLDNNATCSILKICAAILVIPNVSSFLSDEVSADFNSMTRKLENDETCYFEYTTWLFLEQKSKFIDHS